MIVSSPTLLSNFDNKMNVACCDVLSSVVFILLMGYLVFITSYLIAGINSRTDTASQARYLWNNIKMADCNMENVETSHRVLRKPGNHAVDDDQGNNECDAEVIGCWELHRRLSFTPVLNYPFKTLCLFIKLLLFSSLSYHYGLIFILLFALTFIHSCIVYGKTWWSLLWLGISI